MSRTSLMLISCLAVPLAGFAQNEDVHHNNITLGVGPAMPFGSAKNYLSTAPFINVSYGYRFNRLFQADTGLNFAFGAANNQNAVETTAGTVQGGDHEFMIPLGGRVILPLHLKRLQVSAGGGGIYLHYSETAPSGGYYYPVDCYTCTSRSGWGGYGLADAAYFLDSNHNFRVGATFMYVSASTNGQAVGNIPANSTTDHWGLLSFNLGMSF